MVSLVNRSVCKVLSRALAIAALAHPEAARPQPADADAEIVDRIRTEQAVNGPYSVDLLDPLTSLGFLYQERGDHVLAAAALERARQVVRANYGLTALDQAPLLRQQIRSEEALGNFREAWDLEQHLQGLARVHPEDLRTVPILREIGDRRMGVLASYLAGERPPEVVLGCYYAPEPRAREHGRCDSGSRSVAVQSIVTDAQSNYLDAIRVMLRHELYSSAELRDLEMELVRSSYEHGRYDVGRQSLRRLLAYRLASSDSRASQIEAFVQLADWELLFELNQVSALESYQRAFGLLRQDAAEPALVEQIFAPEIPVVLPAFVPNPLVVAQPPATDSRYIDVAFEITRFGTSRAIEVLPTSTNPSSADREALVHLIARSRFRPRAVNGELARSAPIVLRYYAGAAQPRTP